MFVIERYLFVTGNGAFRPFDIVYTIFDFRSRATEDRTERPRNRNHSQKNEYQHRIVSIFGNVLDESKICRQVVRELHVLGKVENWHEDFRYFFIHSATSLEKFEINSIIRFNR